MSEPTPDVPREVEVVDLVAVLREAVEAAKKRRAEAERERRDFHAFAGDMTAPDQHKFHRAKLTSHQREEIKRRYADGESCKALSAEFGVTAKYISTFVDARSALESDSFFWLGGAR